MEDKQRRKWTYLSLVAEKLETTPGQLMEKADFLGLEIHNQLKGFKGPWVPVNAVEALKLSGGLSTAAHEQKYRPCVHPCCNSVGSGPWGLAMCIRHAAKFQSLTRVKARRRRMEFIHDYGFLVVKLMEALRRGEKLKPNEFARLQARGLLTESRQLTDAGYEIMRVCDILREELVA